MLSLVFGSSMHGMVFSGVGRFSLPWRGCMGINKLPSPCIGTWATRYGDQTKKRSRSSCWHVNEI
jgi:hypothetical protein